MSDLSAALRRRRVAVVIIGDSAAWLLAFYISAWMRYDSASAPAPWLRITAVALIAVLTYDVLASATRFHQGRAALASLEEMMALGGHAVVAGGVISVVNLGTHWLPRSVPIAAALIAVVLSAAARAVWRRLREMRHERRSAKHATGVVVVGAGQAGRELVASMQADPLRTWHPVGFLDDDPGKVVWAPSVFKMAEDFGLKLLKGGKLVDTTLGEKVPEGAEMEQPPDAAKLKELATPPMSELQKYAIKAADMKGNANSPLAGPGVEEDALIGDVDSMDGFKAGPIIGHWNHGFALRRLKLETGATIPTHARAEQEVVFVQSGTLEFTWDGGKLILGAGDTLTVPVGRCLGAG